MKPTAAHALVNFAGILRNDFLPQLNAFSAGNAGMIAAMLDMMAEEWDRAAARLVAENTDIQAVLVRGADYLPGVAAPTGGENADLRVSVLEAENERLRAALIDLHTAVESADSPEARAIEDEIWSILSRSVESRRVSLANF